MHHVGSFGFGQGISPFEPGNDLYDTYMTVTITDDWTRQLALMEDYDQTYQIFDHELNREMDPLSIIGMHPAEDPITGSRLDTLMRELIACRIPELTHTPLLDLLQYPRYRLDKLLEDGRKARKKEDATVTQMNLDLGLPQ